jgi:hypothetical protein
VFAALGWVLFAGTTVITFARMACEILTGFRTRPTSKPTSRANCGESIRSVWGQKNVKKKTNILAFKRVSRRVRTHNSCTCAMSRRGKTLVNAMCKSPETAWAERRPTKFTEEISTERKIWHFASCKRLCAREHTDRAKWVIILSGRVTVHTKQKRNRRTIVKVNEIRYREGRKCLVSFFPTLSVYPCDTYILL